MVLTLGRDGAGELKVVGGKRWEGERDTVVKEDEITAAVRKEDGKGVVVGCESVRGVAVRKEDRRGVVVGCESVRGVAVRKEDMRGVVVGCESVRGVVVGCESVRGVPVGKEGGRGVVVGCESVRGVAVGCESVRGVPVRKEGRRVAEHGRRVVVRCEGGKGVAVKKEGGRGAVVREEGKKKKLKMVSEHQGPAGCCVGHGQDPRRDGCSWDREQQAFLSLSPVPLGRWCQSSRRRRFAASNPALASCAPACPGPANSGAPGRTGSGPLCWERVWSRHGLEDSRQSMLVSWEWTLLRRAVGLAALG